MPRQVIDLSPNEYQFNDQPLLHEGIWRAAASIANAPVQMQRIQMEADDRAVDRQNKLLQMDATRQEIARRPQVYAQQDEQFALDKQYKEREYKDRVLADAQRRLQDTLSTSPGSLLASPDRSIAAEAQRRLAAQQTAMDIQAAELGSKGVMPEAGKQYITHPTNVPFNDLLRMGSGNESQNLLQMGNQLSPKTPTPQMAGYLQKERANKLAENKQEAAIKAASDALALKEKHMLLKREDQRERDERLFEHKRALQQQVLEGRLTDKEYEAAIAEIKDLHNRIEALDFQYLGEESNPEYVVMKESLTNALNAAMSGKAALRSNVPMPSPGQGPAVTAPTQAVGGPRINFDGIK